MTPKRMHRLAAYLETFTWAFLILGMILKYSGTTAAVIPFAGGIHGFGFLCFLLMTALLWVNNRWTFATGIVGLIVSIIPFAALPFALWADKKKLLEGSWRFADPSETPHTLPDKILAQAVRYTTRTTIIAIVVVAIVFSILLLLGPPVDVESALNNTTNS